MAKREECEPYPIRILYFAVAGIGAVLGAALWMIVRKVLHG